MDINFNVDFPSSRTPTNSLKTEYPALFRLFPTLFFGEGKVNVELEYESIYPERSAYINLGDIQEKVSNISSEIISNNIDFEDTKEQVSKFSYEIFNNDEVVNNNNNFNPSYNPHYYDDSQKISDFSHEIISNNNIINSRENNIEIENTQKKSSNFSFEDFINRINNVGDLQDFVDVVNNYNKYILKSDPFQSQVESIFSVLEDLIIKNTKHANAAIFLVLLQPKTIRKEILEMRRNEQTLLDIACEYSNEEAINYILEYSDNN